MNGKQAKKLRRFAKVANSMNPNSNVEVLYEQLKTIHKKKNNTEKYETYKKVQSAAKICAVLLLQKKTDEQHLQLNLQSIK